MHSRGRVALVGGGPGDPGLITRRGLERLQTADAVVYDRLVNEALLQLAPSEAERIYVGKKAGSHRRTQSEINALLINLAREGKQVVRLKGGDPFVFGRGGEEAEALATAGIAFEVVPGISSAIAVPAYAGIPVTHRNVASSVAVLTGHEAAEKAESSIDWSALARVDTLVVLMGVGNLSRIVQKLVSNGRASETPVALIERGTWGKQRTLVGTLNDIVQLAHDADLEPPAVIVVGKVVALQEKLQWFNPGPLNGLRILVTRTEHQAEKLSAPLGRLGAEPVECPLIEIQPPSDWAPLDAAIARLDSRDAPAYDWILFTSTNGVAFFFERLALSGHDTRTLAGVRVGAIGSATAKALSNYGLVADLVPDTYVAEALADGMGLVAGQRVLLARADIARPALAQRLIEAGAYIEEVAAYRTVAPEGLTSRLQTLLPDIDVITLTSSSTVRHLVDALGPTGRKVLRDITLACIGPITAGTARELGLEPAVVANVYNMDGLVKALLKWRQTEGKEAPC